MLEPTSVFSSDERRFSSRAAVVVAAAGVVVAMMASRTARGECWRESFLGTRLLTSRQGLGLGWIFSFVDCDSLSFERKEGGDPKG